ncbi:MAG: CDP-diacylglycerol--glycerol-3-phosphate 3-phosphatidyltransferase [Bacilli bacterium]|nr:CDP-diacylglycerol--glycerol-3-phosphate 3-phosphatidyltransferase [Bacilli bacterium]
MNLPTKITFTRIFATVAIFIALFVLYLIKVFNPSFTTPYLEIANVRVDWIFIVLLVIFILVSLTDMLDGRLARSRNEVTTFGKFLDPIADKLLVNSFCLFLIAPQVFASYNQAQTVGIALWCAILMVARDIVVDALRFIAASKNVVISANIFGKLKTIFQMIAIGVVLANDFPFAFFDQGFPAGLRISDILVYIATAISVVSGIIYVVQNKQVFKDND